MAFVITHSRVLNDGTLIERAEWDGSHAIRPFVSYLARLEDAGPFVSGAGASVAEAVGRLRVAVARWAPQPERLAA